jgi:hypothetical protein
MAQEVAMCCVRRGRVEVDSCLGKTTKRTKPCDAIGSNSLQTIVRKETYMVPPYAMLD